MARALRLDVAAAPAAARPMPRFRRAFQILRAEGARSLWFRALAETVYRRLLLYEYPLDVLPPRVPSEVPLELGFLSASDAGQYGLLRPDTPAEIVARRFDRGERCFAGRHDGRLVSARWLASGDVYVDYLGCWIRLAPGAVYIHDTFTSPDYRGKRVSAAVATHVASVLADEGHDVAVGLALRENRSIHRVIARAGLEPRGTIRAFGPRGLRRTFVAGGSGLIEIRG